MRAVTYLNRPRERALKLERPPRYPPISVNSFELRKNPLLRMLVQSSTKKDHKIEFSGSKNRLGTLRFALKALIFAKIVLCACACIRRLKYISKSNSAGPKSPRYAPICVKSFDFRENLPLGMRGVSYTKMDLKEEPARYPPIGVKKFEMRKNPLLRMRVQS